MSNVKWPTTMILLAIIASSTVLGWNSTLDGQAVVAIYTAIIGGVLVGHYVKTTNGSLVAPPQETRSSVQDGVLRVETGPAPAPPPKEGEQL